MSLVWSDTRRSSGDDQVVDDACRLFSSVHDCALPTVGDVSAITDATIARNGGSESVSERVLPVSR